MIAIIPSNFDLYRHIENYPPVKYNINKFNIDHAMFIISQVYETASTNKMKEKEAMRNDGFIEIYSKHLQKYVRDYYLYMKYFIDTEIIESDNYYIPPTCKTGDTKCYGYKFTKLYQNSKPKVFTYSYQFDKVLTNDLKRKYASIYIEYGHLSKFYYPECKLKIDKDKALHFIETKKETQITNPESRDVKKTYNDKILYKDHNDQYNFSFSMIELLYNQSFDCKVDQTVYRMHTPLTNMYSPLRNFLKHENEELYSIDICNSQPYLSLILFNSNIYNKNNIINKCNNKIYKELAKNPLMLCTATELANNEDFIKFQNLVGNTGIESHDLYSYMLEMSTNNQTGFTSRSEAKSGMFEALFSSDQHVTESKRLFNQIFPTVSKMFKTIKKGDHTRLSILLQSVESYLILKVITKQLAAKYPHIPLYTIHDSIATTKPYIDIVRRYMTDVLTKKIGVPPKLKTELWSESSLDDSTFEYEFSIR